MSRTSIADQQYPRRGEMQNANVTRFLCNDDEAAIPQPLEKLSCGVWHKGYGFYELMQSKRKKKFSNIHHDSTNSNPALSSFSTDIVVVSTACLILSRCRFNSSVIMFSASIILFWKIFSLGFLIGPEFRTALVSLLLLRL
jgi:hypothetical protein